MTRQLMCVIIENKEHGSSMFLRARILSHWIEQNEKHNQSISGTRSFLSGGLLLPTEYLQISTAKTSHSLLLGSKGSINTSQKQTE